MNLIIFRWPQIYVLMLWRHLRSKMTCQLRSRVKCRWEGSVRVFIIYCLSSWFSPYGTKVFSFHTHKFSRCIKRSDKICLELEVETSLSMIINLVWLLKLWSCCWKCLKASIAFWFLVSFLWLFNLMLNAVAAFPTFCLLHSVHSMK